MKFLRGTVVNPGTAGKAEAIHGFFLSSRYLDAIIPSPIRAKDQPTENG